MIEYYLSSNNEMCYNDKTQSFSATKHALTATLVTRTAVVRVPMVVFTPCSMLLLPSVLFGIL